MEMFHLEIFFIQVFFFYNTLASFAMGVPAVFADVTDGVLVVASQHSTVRGGGITRTTGIYDDRIMTSSKDSQ